MSTALIFLATWRKWQRELQCRKGFGLFDSFRFGLWLARGSAAPAQAGASRRNIRHYAHGVRREATTQ
jgi:hypothetical protein